jgi:hypothetical protein
VVVAETFRQLFCDFSAPSSPTLGLAEFGGENETFHNFFVIDAHRAFFCAVRQENWDSSNLDFPFPTADIER